MKQVVCPTEDRRELSATVCSACFLTDTLGKTPPCKSILQPLSHTGDGSLNRCIMEHHILVQKHHLQRTEWQHQHTRNGSNLACPNEQNWNQLFLVAQSNLQFKTTQYHVSKKYNCLCSSPTSRSPSKHIAKQYFEWRKESKSHTCREEKNWSQIKYWKNRSLSSFNRTARGNWRIGKSF